MESWGNWLLCGELGQGGFGKVHHWRHRSGGQEIATKHIKDLNSLSADQQIKLSERWNQEYNWTREFQQLPHIVAGVILDEVDPAFRDFLNGRHIAKLPVIVLEYCNGGDVRKRLLSPENANGLVEFEVREILGALRLAVYFLHSKCGVCHRDLKPDNIVIHRGPDGKKVYKLTDFGLARGTPDKTMLQSVVGTRNYFAPEVVESGIYNKAVDYWSLGIIAYEMAIGDLPFIPYQTPKNIIMSLLKKPRDIIAITEDPAVPSRFLNHKHLPNEHHLSRPWAEKLTQWLRLSLDSDQKRRGQVASDEVQSVPVVFSSLDQLLQMKVLTIFAVNSSKRLEYAVTDDMTKECLMRDIARDTKMAVEDIYLVLPTFHPHKKITPSTKPIDLYVEEWRDTSKDTRKWTKRSIPPVMVYVFQGKGTEYSVPEPVFSTLMLNCNGSKFKSEERWLLKRLALDMHFVISKEQANVEMFLSGINEHALELEDEIIASPYKDIINKQLLTTACVFNQLEKLRTEANAESPSIQLNDSAEWERLKTSYQVITDSANKLLAHFDSCFREARNKVNATKQLLQDYGEKDIFNVNGFQRRYLRNGGSISLGEFREAVKEFGKTYQKLQIDGPLVKEAKMIDTLHLHFATGRLAVPTAIEKFEQIKSDISKLLLEMLKSAASPPTIASMPPISISAPPPAVLQLSDEMSRLTVNTMHPSSDPFDSISTYNVIAEAELINQM
ncbi:hypothetical protein KR200_007124 [Drosophila serrata]|nr:hypothetical protein KR200_007124 [Drosophila serrata]